MTKKVKKPIAVIIPAAGFGRRMNSNIVKQFMVIKGRTILAHTVNKIKRWANKYNHQIIIMVSLSKEAVLPDDVAGVTTCIGGKSRSDSVINALDAIDNLGIFDWVIIHDAVRPLINIAEIENLYQSLKNDKVGGILASKITATVKKVQDGIIVKTIPRKYLWLAQTPQLFRFKLLRQSLKNSNGLTDESAAIEKMGLQVKIIMGSSSNIKVTTADDLKYLYKKI